MHAYYYGKNVCMQRLFLNKIHLKTWLIGIPNYNSSFLQWPKFQIKAQQFCTKFFLLRETSEAVNSDFSLIFSELSIWRLCAGLNSMIKIIFRVGQQSCGRC
jgi:hypothetical protein